VAVALAQARAAVRADVLDGHHVASGPPEQAQLLAQEGDFQRLAPADGSVLDGGIPVVPQPELRDQGPDVAAELGDAVRRMRVGGVKAGRGLRGRCRHAEFLSHLRA
jgi:hypothetical protein